MRYRDRIIEKQIEVGAVEQVFRSGIEKGWHRIVGSWDA